MQVSFTVIGEPKGKQRPRVVHTGGRTMTYTPGQTVMYENLVRYSYMEQVGRVKLKAPVKADITAVFPIPKSVSKKQRERMTAGEVLHTKKADSDNIAKAILDSVNKIAYDDDAGVAVLTVRKVYGETPRVDVTLTEI